MPIHDSRILFEDDHLLAVNKLSGELVVKGAGKVQKLPLFDHLKKTYPEIRVLHRIDYDTSGVILFAKTRSVERTIVDSNFANWKKIYKALVARRMRRDAGTIRKPLPARGKGTIGATTHYKVLQKFANSSYVELEIESGRHHQIRRHMAMIGNPLVMDLEYGHRPFNKVFRQEFGYNKFFLHASELSLLHPNTGESLQIIAPMPKSFQSIVKKLGSL